MRRSGEADQALTPVGQRQEPAFVNQGYRMTKLPFVINVEQLLALLFRIQCGDCAPAKTMSVRWLTRLSVVPPARRTRRRALARGIARPPVKTTRFPLRVRTRLEEIEHRSPANSQESPETHN